MLQAAPASSSTVIPYTSPNAQFYVLRDHVALLGSDITNPQQSTDSTTGQPDVTFGFTSKGQREFQTVTKAIARRGELVSGLGNQYNQHFAVALDNQLITVPSIDYKQYPRRHRRLQRRQHHRRLHDPDRPRTWPPSCVWARCRSSSSSSPSPRSPPRWASRRCTRA